MFLGLTTAVTASVCYGAGSVLQAVGARRTAREQSDATTAHGGPRASAIFKTALTWEFIVGSGLDFAGFVLGSTASRLLPLFLSQTVISANLVITALLSVRMLGLRLRAPEWVSIAVVCFSLVLLAVAAGPEGHARTSTASHWGLFAVSVVIIVGGILVVRVIGARGAVPAGLLSGLGFGALGIGIRTLDGVERFDVADMMADPALYGIAVAGLGGMYLHTVALQLGSVNGATAALVVGETVLPGIIGVLWLGDSYRPGFAVPALTGFVLAVAGAVAVAWLGDHEAEAEPVSA